MKYENEFKARMYEAVRFEAKRRGCTMERVCEDAEVHFTLLYGKNNPRLDTLINICCATGVSADWVLGLRAHGGPGEKEKDEP